MDLFGAFESYVRRRTLDHLALWAGGTSTTITTLDDVGTRDAAARNVLLLLLLPSATHASRLRPGLFALDGGVG